MLNLIGKASAALPGAIPTLTTGNLTGTGGLIDTVLSWVLGLAAAIAVIYLIYGGILYITAGGDAEKATKGRTALINAIIGIVIIALSYLIVTWVSDIIGGGRA
jgi:hypothetical protein